jgi:pentalenic acid synthase
MTASISREHTPDGREAWRVRGYPEVTELLVDPRLAIQPPAGAVRSWFPDSPMSRIMLRLADQAVPEGGTHGEERDRRRDSIRAMLDRDTVRRLSPDVQMFADELIDDVIKVGPPADLNRQYGVLLCARVACALLGVPADDITKFQSWAADKESSDYRKAALSLRDLNRYVKNLIQRAKDEPGDDIASHLVSFASEDATERDASTAEILSWILSLGWQVPAAALDTGLRLFLANPAQRSLLRDQPDLLASATEEVLRLFKLVPDDMGGVDRFPVQDMEIEGQRLCQGDLVVLDVSAANRDPNVFPEPAEFDIRRNPNHHLTFGRGAYYCHFSRVARQEISVGLETVFRRLPGLRPAEPRAEPPAEPLAEPAGTGALMVTWDDARDA